MAGETTEAEEVNPDSYATLDGHAEQVRDQDERTEIIEDIPPIFMRGALYVTVGVIVIVGILTWIAHVPMKVLAAGQLVPEGDNVPVQSQGAGTVTEVSVQVGDLVEKGQKLFSLQETQIGMDVAIKKQELELKERELREVQDARNIVQEFIDNPDLILSRSAGSYVGAGKAVQTLNSLRFARMALDKAKTSTGADQAKALKQVDGQIAVNRQTAAELQKSIAAAQNQVKQLKAQVVRAKKEIKELEGLVQQNIVPQSELTTKQGALFAIENQISQVTTQMGQTRVQLQQSRLKTGQLEKRKLDLAKGNKDAVQNADLSYKQSLAALSSFIAVNKSHETGIQADIDKLKKLIELQEQKVTALDILSPVGGTIANMPINTVGAVVSRGALVATIVPFGAEPIVLARVKNKDVAFVKPGLTAYVKVDAFPFRQFGTVPATVERVFPEIGKSDFIVKLRLSKSFINVKGEDVPLVPGLAVKADIVTKRMKIIELIFDRLRGSSS